MCQCFLNHQLVADSQVATLNYHHRLRPSSSSSWNISLRNKLQAPLPSTGYCQPMEAPSYCSGEVATVSISLPLSFYDTFSPHSPVYTHHIVLWVISRVADEYFRQNATPLFQQQHLSQFALTARSSSLMLPIDLIKIIFLIKIMIIVII